MNQQRVLVVGKDGRTDAIAAACRLSPSGSELFAFSENPIPGLVEKCRDVIIGSLTDRAQLRQVVERVMPTLVIIGPEEPLAAGFVDELDQLGILAFGPTQELAAIESSKSWARYLMDRHVIPGNPEYRVFTALSGLREYMADLGAFVIKPDGLTGGKGVQVFGEHLHSLDDALSYAEAVISTHGRVAIEERLEGEEFSLQTITDGKTAVHCPLVQDHKRAYEGDEGPNTGGMGSYSAPDHGLPFLTQADVQAARSINERVIEALESETGKPYRGVLYGGFMATADGVRVIEYNARFGDPEAMNVLPLLEGDFIEVCHAVAAGTLDQVSFRFASKATVCKYVVPSAYPEGRSVGGSIRLPDGYRDSADLRWYWAACRKEGDQVMLTQSRAGAFVGIGDTLADAERMAEEAASAVSGHVRHRSDIGRDEVIEARVQHMRMLRGSRATGHFSTVA